MFYRWAPPTPSTICQVWQIFDAVGWGNFDRPHGKPPGPTERRKREREKGRRRGGGYTPILFIHISVRRCKKKSPPSSITNYDMVVREHPTFNSSFLSTYVDYSLTGFSFVLCSDLGSCSAKFSRQSFRPHKTHKHKRPYLSHEHQQITNLPLINSYLFSSSIHVVLLHKKSYHKYS